MGVYNGVYKDVYSGVYKGVNSGVNEGAYNGAYIGAYAGAYKALRHRANIPITKTAPGVSVFYRPPGADSIIFRNENNSGKRFWSSEVIRLLLTESDAF